MKFNSLQEIDVALVKLRATGKRTHYPPLFKKAVMDFQPKSDMSLKELGKYMELGNSTIYSWHQADEDGLLSLEGAYNTSRISKDLNQAIIDNLTSDIKQAQRKLELVRECSAAGIKVG